MRKIEGKWVKFRYDPDNDIVFAEDHWQIKTKKDVDEFVEEYNKFILKMNRKFWLIAHIDDLIIHPDVTEYYGKCTQRLASEHVLGYVRWGTNSYARLSLRTSSMAAKMHQNIYSSIEEAIQAVKEMKIQLGSGLDM